MRCRRTKVEPNNDSKPIAASAPQVGHKRDSAPAIGEQTRVEMEAARADATRCGRQFSIRITMAAPSQGESRRVVARSLQLQVCSSPGTARHDFDRSARAGAKEKFRLLTEATSGAAFLLDRNNNARSSSNKSATTSELAWPSLQSCRRQFARPSRKICAGREMARSLGGRASDGQFAREIDLRLASERKRRLEIWPRMANELRLGVTHLGAVE